MQTGEFAVIWSWVAIVHHSGPGALFSFTSVSLVMLASMVWQIRCIPIGVMSSAAVAVVLGAADLGLGQHEEHLRLGFHFRRRAVRSCISWRRCADACFVVAAFLFLCVRATQYHSRWYRVQVRQSTRGWTWNCASLGSRLRST